MKQHANGKCVRKLLSVLVTTIAFLVIALGWKLEARADGAILYINDSADGSGNDIVVTGSASGAGWSYDEESNTLTLNGFNGSYIETVEDINVLLQGQNVITVTEMVAPNYGMYSQNKTFTIDATNATDSLKIQADFEEQTFELIESDVVLNGGNLTLIGTMKGTSPICATGWGSSITVNNDANLTVDISGNGTVYGCEGKGSGAAVTANTTGSVSVTVASVGEGYEGYGVGCLVAKGSGTVTISAPVQENVFAIARDITVGSEAGTVNLNGMVQYVYIYSLASNKTFGDGKYYWKNFGNSYNREWRLLDANGVPITSTQIVTQEDQDLFIGITDVYLTGMKQGVYFRPSDYPDLREATHGGKAPYKYEIKEGTSLPKGLVVYNYNYGNIQGTPEEACEAGTAIMVVSDSSNPKKTKEITIHYDAVAEKDWFVTVDGTQFNAKTDQSGTGWSYAWGGEIGTLTLENYNGGPIGTDANVNVLLKGTNVITLSEANDDQKGLYSDYKTITLDVADATSSLKIQADFEEKGFELVRSNVVLNGGTLTLNGTSNGTAEVCGTGWTSTVKINNDANLTVNVSGKGTVYGCEGKGSGAAVTANTTGTVSVTVANVGEGYEGYGVGCLVAQGSGTVTISVPVQENVFAIARDVTVGSEAGIVNLSGMVQYVYTCSLAGNKTFGDGKYYWKNYGNSNNKAWRLLDVNGEPITATQIVTQEDQDLFIGITDVYLTGMKQGVYFRPSDYPDLREATHGGKAPYKYEIKEGTSLPKGLVVYNYNYGNIQGTPEEACEAGTAIMVVSDSSNPKKTVEITIHYDEVEPKVAVTDVAISPKSLKIEEGQTAELTATVLPEDCSLAEVIFAAEGEEIVRLDETTHSISGNVSKITIFGKKPGAATVTATTRQGKLKDVCSVTVTEARPNARVRMDAGVLSFTNLVANAAYSIDGTRYEANSAGILTNLPESLLGKRVSLIKLNDDEELNSAAQTLDLTALSSGDSYDDTLNISNVNIVLQNNLALQLFSSKSLYTQNGYDAPFIVFNVNGKEKTVQATDDGTNYVFTCNNIAPQMIGDKIGFTVYAMKNGAKVKGMSAAYAVKDYCDYVLQYMTSDVKLRTLIVDLLNYGAATQTYANYKTDAMVNKDLTTTQQGWATEKERDYVYSAALTNVDAADLAGVSITNMSLVLNETVAIRYFFTATSISGLTLEIKDAKGQTWTLGESDFVKESDNNYHVDFRKLQACRMSDVVYATFHKGSQKSYTAVYSIESYASIIPQYTTDQKLLNLISCMMKYGDAAKAYANK